MIRDNHYEEAFESYLRSRRSPYVAVDETRRTLLQDASLKSLDFIVYAEQAPHLLVDVKGRQFPGSGGRKWENWATDEDIESLLKWQQVFGRDYRSILVFAYELLSESPQFSEAETFAHRARRYAFFGTWVDEYQERMKVRSPSWKTVTLPSADFSELRAPIEQFLGGVAVKGR